MGQTLSAAPPQGLIAGEVPSGAFPLLAPNGSVSAPSYAFSTEPTSGWYRHDADYVSFSKEGTRTLDVYRDSSVGFFGVHGASSFAEVGLTLNTYGSGSAFLSLSATAVKLYTSGTTSVQLAPNNVVALSVEEGKLGMFTTTPVAAKTGWTPPTGTGLRTGFATSTATLEQVAQTVKALIDDLHQTAGYGFLRT